MIAAFLDRAPPGAAATMQALATAESLTDAVATELYLLAPISGLDAPSFLFALRQSSLVEPRNSEWSFPPAIRQAFRASAALTPDTLEAAHALLLERGREGDRALAGSAIPSYLFTDAGQAYHSAALGRVEEALALYGRSTQDESWGVQWLASTLVEEQQRDHILPDDATEALFLRAMVLHRDGRFREAEPLFRRIVEKDEPNTYTEAACDILGVALRRRDRAEAERLLRRAVEIARLLGNLTGEGVHLHNLALALPPSAKREMEELYRRSIAIAEGDGDDYSAAIRKNGLGDLLGHAGRKRRGEAERLLREGVRYFSDRHDDVGGAKLLTTLARLVAQDPERWTEAEEMYRSAIDVARRHDDQYSLSLRLSGLGRLLARRPGRAHDARALIEESLAIGERFTNARQIRELRALLDELDTSAPPQS